MVVHLQEKNSIWQLLRAQGFSEAPRSLGIHLAGSGRVSARHGVTWVKAKHWGNETEFWWDDKLITASLFGGSDG